MIRNDSDLFLRGRNKYGQIINIKRPRVCTIKRALLAFGEVFDCCEKKMAVVITCPV
jgi:hypothetical protein